MNDCIRRVEKDGKINMNDEQRPMIVLSEAHEKIDTLATYVVHTIMILIWPSEQ